MLTFGGRPKPASGRKAGFVKGRCSIKKLMLLVVLLAGMVLVQGCEKRTPKKKETPTNITFEEVVAAADSRPDIPHNSTSLQRDTIWRQHNGELTRKYIGKLVEWTGTVVCVEKSRSTLKVEFRHIEAHLSDVTVTFPATYTAILLGLQRGGIITYKGRISKLHNGRWFNIQLSCGSISEKEAG